MSHMSDLGSLCVPCFHGFCYLLCSKTAALGSYLLSSLHQGGCNYGSGAESIFSALKGNARLMWSSLADDFSSLFMTLSAKLIVFNNCER